MKIGILISTGDAEIIWNAFRFANLCMNTDVTNEVSIFMHGKAVEYEDCDSKQFNIKELAKTFVTKYLRVLIAIIIAITGLKMWYQVLTVGS